MAVVLDSSFLVSVFSEEDKFHVAGRNVLLKIIKKEIEATVPTLAMPEVCGVIRRKFGLHQAMIVENMLNTWIDSNMIFVKELTKDRMKSSAEEAIRFGLRGEDAIFVSLTRELGMSLLTFDEEVKKKIKGKVKLFDVGRL